MARSLTSTLDKLAASGKLDKFTTAQPTTGELQTSIEISRIIPDPDQPRRTFDEDQLQSLSDSIAAQGVLQPITVQPENADGQYLIIMGERRWRAAQLVGLTSIPSIIRKATAELRAIQLTENVQRSDLTTMEIARAVEQMRKDGKKRSEIARALGWGQVQVSQFAGILDMPDALQDLANQNVSARPLSDLHALWKKDEDAARKFISETPVEDISRVSVAALRSRMDAEKDKTPVAAPIPDVHIDAQPPSRTQPSPTKLAGAGDGASPVSRTSVAILCFHGGEPGRILTDRKASSNSAIMVSFADGTRIEEIPLREIELSEVIEL